MMAGTLLLTPVKRKQTGIGNRRFVLSLRNIWSV